MSRPPRSSSRTGLLLAAVLVLFALLLVGVVAYGMLASRQTGPPPPGRGAPVTPAAGPGTPPALDGLVRVVFTDPRDQDRPAERRGGLDEQLTAFLKTATTSIDMAIYDLDLENVTAAMIEAQRRGVVVRVVTDTDNMKAEAIAALAAATIPVVADARGALMHDKFAVVDRGAVWMGSWNFTVDDTYRYNNAAALWRSKPLAEAYAAEFDKLFNGQFGARSRTAGSAPDVVVDEARGVRVEAYFTPEDDPTPAIIRRIQGARTSVLFLAYSFTRDDIGRAMIDRYRAGVQVRGVFEKTGTDTASSPSEYRPMKAADIDVVQDGNRYLMHHKVIIIDERTVIFGSYNFSANANANNENCLIVDSPELAWLFVREFDAVYARAVAAP